MSHALLEEEEPAYAVDMKNAEAEAIAPPAPTPLDARHDRLAVGMVYLLALMVVQRGIGLARNVLLCRLLGPEELGRWNLAFSFLMVAGPVAALGLSGAFGRYAEHYRQRGQLQTFLWRTGLATLLLTMISVTVLLAAPRASAQLFFRDEAQVGLAVAAALTLATVVAFNFFTELFTALRRARVASTMQFAHGMIFTVLGLGLVAGTSWGAEGVVTAYGLASLGACLGAVTVLRTVYREAPVAETPHSHIDFWSKLLPFALWVWGATLLSNLSDVADRYMILYFSGADAAAGSAMVGQYHSSRVAPDLLASVAAMLAGMLLPYNTHDWEAGRREAVSRRLNLAIKMTGVLFTAAGAALLVLAQPLFSRVLDGKYAAGEAVLPWTLLLCIWYSLGLLAINYLWCAEKAPLALLAMAVGLAANIALNVVLLPRWGLTGAVAATAGANALALVCAYLLDHRLGMRIEMGTALASAAPLSILLGPAAAGATVFVLGALAFASDRFLSAGEKAQIAQAIRSFWRRAS